MSTRRKFNFPFSVARARFLLEEFPPRECEKLIGGTQGGTQDGTPPAP